MRRSVTAIGFAVLAVFGVSITAKDLSEYSLRVTILQVRWQDGNFGPSGDGRGNVDDGATRRGFDFTFACSRRFNATTGTDFYQAKWKKPETRLEIVMVEIGNTNHQSECELKTTVKDFAYVMANGNLATTPIGRRTPQQTSRQVTPQVPRRAGTVQELIGRAETEVRTALGEPFQIDGPRWTYQTTTGQVYLYVGGGFVSDVQPPTVMVNSIVRSAPVPTARVAATQGGTVKSNGGKLTNADVIAMVNASLSAEIIVAKMNGSACEFDTSPDGLRQLKAAKVPDAIVLEMIKHPAK